MVLAVSLSQPLLSLVAGAETWGVDSRDSNHRLEERQLAVNTSSRKLGQRRDLDLYSPHAVNHFIRPFL